MGLRRVTKHELELSCPGCTEDRPVTLWVDPPDRSVGYGSPTLADFHLPPCPKCGHELSEDEADRAAVRRFEQMIEDEAYEARRGRGQ